MDKWKKMKLTGKIVNTFNILVEKIQSSQLEADDDR
jgi:hypothetical protein